MNSPHLMEYIERMKPEQGEIFYYCTPKRSFAEDSPYYEPFKSQGIEVLFLHHPLDEFVMGRLGKYNEKKLVPIDSEDATKAVQSWNKDKKDEGPKEGDSKALTDEQSTEMCEWFRSTLDTSVKEVQVSHHTGSYPAVVTNFDSPSVRRKYPIEFYSDVILAIFPSFIKLRCLNTSTFAF